MANQEALAKAATNLCDAFGDFEWKTDLETGEGYWAPSARMIDTELVARLFNALNEKPSDDSE